MKTIKGRKIRILAGVAIMSIIMTLPLGCAKSKAPSGESQQKAPGTQQQAAVTYNNTIKPLFDQKCVPCHSTNGSAAGLPLTTYDEVKATVKPGKPQESGLVKSVDGGSMSGKLTGDEINKVKDWVSQGAKEK